MKGGDKMKGRYSVSGYIPLTPSNDFLGINRFFAKEYFDTKEEAKKFIEKMKKETWKYRGASFETEIFGSEIEFKLERR
jgi:thioredoxin-related protein